MLLAATHFLARTHDSAQWLSHVAAELQQDRAPDERLAAEPSNDPSKDIALTNIRRLQNWRFNHIQIDFASPKNQTFLA